MSTDSSNDRSGIRDDLVSYLFEEIFGVVSFKREFTSLNDSNRNFFNVPIRLEKLIFHGVLVCFDSFFYVFTYFPIRILLSLTCALALVPRTLNKNFDEYISTKSKLLSFTPLRKFDGYRGLVMLCSVLFLMKVSTSQIYHFIRSQNTIKLYVLASMIEIVDKLLSSFGQDVFDDIQRSLFIYNRISIFPLLMGVFYVCAHSFLYFSQVATLSVVVNSADDALLTVLIINNFTELKGFVFKKYDQNNLFQLACADITERFQILLFLFLVFLITLFTQGTSHLSEYLYNFAKIFLMIVVGESVADGVKHSFICKFNSINVEVYENYLHTIITDITNTGADSVVSDHTFKLSRRLGISQVGDFFFGESAYLISILASLSMCVYSLLTGNYFIW
jgi:hypothetical protein